MKPKILVVGAQHGDERLGPRVERFLRADKTGRYTSVDYLCGNPRALQRNIRFTETDLNRSYGVEVPASYEEKRAARILAHIQKGGYDYVLDIHTSRADVGKFLLATHLDANVLDIVSASICERVAIMPPHIADCSLIGKVQNAISVEYDRNLTYQRQSLREMVDLLDNLLEGKRQPRQREIFYVADKIPLTSKISYENKNFERSPEGFYPIIFTKNSAYTTHKGWAAHKKIVQVI